jgi:cytoskeletal protein RodZ
MPLIRVALLLLLLGAGVALILQNSAPIVVTILGSPTQPIALGWMMLAAVALGLLFGVALQYLLWGAPVLRSPKLPRTKRPKAKTRSSKQKTANQTSRSSANASTSDWYQPSAQDWHDRPQKTSVATDDRRSPQDDEEEDRSPRSRWSSLFETEEDEPNYPRREERVVDADYRVIRPPSRPTTDPEWEDEFFEERR